MSEDYIEHVMLNTMDPNTALHSNKRIPAISTLLFRVCDGDKAKFEEACRLIKLILRDALNH